MLIDTRQIVSKTELRDNFNSLLKEVYNGRELFVTDRGKPIIKLSSVKQAEVSPEKLLKRMKKTASDLKDYGSDVDSTEFIRNMRDSRR
jgi:prevent-host-death family protein